MRFLNWVQTRLHGAHCSKKKSESSAGSVLFANASSGLPRNDELRDGWTTGMLSIGTFGTSEGKRPKSCDDSEQLKTRRPLPLKGSLTGGVVKQRSFRKLVTSALGGFLPRSAFSGFLPRPSLRETMPELRVTEETHPENPTLPEAAIKNSWTVQMPWKGNAMGETQGNKWIRTDSEYIVLEI